MACTKLRSRLGCPGVPGAMFHPTGFPVPWGKTTMKPWRCALRLNCVVIASRVAPSESPWKSTTTGIGDPLRAEGTVSRYHRATPSTVMSCRTSVSETEGGNEHPDDGTGAAERAPALPGPGPPPARGKDDKPAAANDNSGP